MGGTIKDSPKDKAILAKRINAGGVTLFVIKLYYKTVVIQKVWYLHKTNTHISENDQKSQKLTYVWSTNFNKLQIVHNGEMTVFSINDVGKAGYPLMKKKEIGTLIPYTIINSNVFLMFFFNVEHF